MIIYISLLIWSGIAPKRVLTRRQSTRIRTTDKAVLVFTPQKCKGILLPGSVETVLDFWQNYLCNFHLRLQHTYKDNFALYSHTHYPSMDVTSDHTLRSLCTSLDVWDSSLLALQYYYRIPSPCSPSASLQHVNIDA